MSEISPPGNCQTAQSDTFWELKWFFLFLISAPVQIHYKQWRSVVLTKLQTHLKCEYFSVWCLRRGRTGAQVDSQLSIFSITNMHFAWSPPCWALHGPARPPNNSDSPSLLITAWLSLLLLTWRLPYKKKKKKRQEGHNYSFSHPLEPSLSLLLYLGWAAVLEPRSDVGRGNETWREQRQLQTHQVNRSKAAVDTQGQTSVWLLMGGAIQNMDGTSHQNHKDGVCHIKKPQTEISP